MHIPKNIPILDEEYMKRRREEAHREAERAYWRKANRPDNLSNTEEQDKQFFVEGKITEEELAQRTEVRWQREIRAAANTPQLALATKKKMSYSTKSLLKDARRELTITAVCAWFVATVLEVAGGKVLAVYIGYPISIVCVLLAMWINRTLKRR